MSAKESFGALGLLLAAGLVGAGFFIGKGITDFKRADRTVTVRGLVEREAKADLALWPIKFKAAGDDLAATQALVENQKTSIITFLTQQGITAEEMQLTGLRVIDHQAQEYGGDAKAPMRYVVTATLQVRSANVDAVLAASQKVSELVKAGVTLADDNYCGGGPAFMFTQLNAIKPEMLAEATKNARASAEQFAKDSSSHVGAIKKASQGYFSITARDKVEENTEGGGSGCGEAGSINKKIRVVLTIDYFLE